MPKSNALLKLLIMSGLAGFMAASMALADESPARRSLFFAAHGTGGTYRIFLTLPGSGQLKPAVFVDQGYPVATFHLNRTEGGEYDGSVGDSTVFNQVRKLKRLEITETEDFVKLSFQYEAESVFGVGCSGHYEAQMKFPKDGAYDPHFTVNHVCYDEAKGWVNEKELDLKAIIWHVQDGPFPAEYGEIVKR